MPVNNLQGRRIAVVGAGVAGLTAARRLGAEGAAVTVFDKSRGLGGRMATRRAGALAFDHGAQFFTARGDGFSQLVAEAAMLGAAALWPARWARYGQGALTPDPVTEARYVGTPGMTGFARGLGAGLTVMTERQIVDLSRTAQGWTLHDAAGAAHDAFDTVVLAVPAPQVVPLATGIADFATTVAAAVYAPCWAVMAAFETPLPLAADAIALDDPVLAWAARDSSKPGRAAQADIWVLHASPGWSRAHIEDDARDVAAALLAQFGALFGPIPDAGHLSAHRWRYALVEQPLGMPCLWDGALRLGACGDWCLGPRVEAAFDSGVALVQHIAAP